MVAYYLLTMVGRAFSSMPGLASGIALQIRNGEIKKFLMQPIDLIGFLFLTRVAHKLVYYGVALVPFAIVFYLFRGYFPGWPPADVLLAFSISLVLAFLLGFFLEATMGMIGFWMLEVSSLLFDLHAVQFLPLRPHVSARASCRRRGTRSCWPSRCSTWPIFPAAVFLAKDRRARDVAGAGDPSGVGRVLHRRLPRGVQPRRAAIQRVRRLSTRMIATTQSYLRVFLTFVRNSLMRDMMFPTNFIIESISSIGWVAMNLALYMLIFQLHEPPRRQRRAGGGLGQVPVLRVPGDVAVDQQLVQMFFMPNAEEFSELIRTGNLDFALLEADRHAVPDFAAKGRLVGGGEPRARACCCWATRCRGSTASRRRSLAVLLYPLYIVLRRADHVQHDDRAGGHQRLARPQPIALRLLVLHHQLRPLPDGDLRRPDRQLAPLDADVPAAGAGGRERAGPPAGQAVPAEYAYLAVFAVVATAVSLVASRWLFQRALAELPQREQLSRSRSLLHAAAMAYHIGHS